MILIFKRKWKKDMCVKRRQNKESIINVCDLVICSFIFQIISGGFKYMFTDVSMVALTIVTIYSKQKIPLCN